MSNVNADQDTAFAQLIQAVTAGAVGHQRTPPIKDYMWSKSLSRDVPSTWTVLTDGLLGNIEGGAPYVNVRSAISEIEFISNADAREVVAGENGATTRQMYAAGVSGAIITDIILRP